MKKVVLFAMLLVSSISMAQLVTNTHESKTIGQIKFLPSDEGVRLKFKSNNFGLRFAGSKKNKIYTVIEFLQEENEISSLIETLEVLEDFDTNHFLRMNFTNNAEIIKLRERDKIT